MADPKNLEDLDLTAPGVLDDLLEQGESEEDSEGLSEDASKQKAAFAKMRKDNKVLRTAFRQAMAKAKESLEGKGQPSRSQMSFTPSGEQQTTLAYQNSVIQRAQQITPYYQGMNNDDYLRSLSLNCTAVIVKDMLAHMENERLAQQAPETVKSVLDKFNQLDEDDKKILTERIDKLPVQLKADPQTVKREVYAYMGENIGKFAPAAPEEKGKGKREETGEKEETPGKPFPARVTSMGQSEKAGAAVASEGKVGSQGIKLSPKQQSSRESEPEVAKADKEVMLRTGLDPGNPAHVERYLKAKRKNLSPESPRVF